MSEQSGDLALSFQGHELLLEPFGLARFGVLRPPSERVTFAAATVVKAIDGRTLSVTLDESGEAATVQLIGLDVPVKEECFASDSKKRLATLAGSSVLLEIDGNIADDKRLKRHVWTGDGSLLIASEFVAGGFATASSQDHRFRAMYSASEAAAEDEIVGMWAECQSGPAADQPPAEEPDSTPLTEEERAYLTDLLKRPDELDSNNEQLKLVLSDGVVKDFE